MSVVAILIIHVETAKVAMFGYVCASLCTSICRRSNIMAYGPQYMKVKLIEQFMDIIVDANGKSCIAHICEEHSSDLL